MYPIHYFFETPSSASRSPPWCLKWLSAPDAEEVFNTTGTETQFQRELSSSILLFKLKLFRNMY